MHWSDSCGSEQSGVVSQVSGTSHHTCHRIPTIGTYGARTYGAHSQNRIGQIRSVTQFNSRHTLEPYKGLAPQTFVFFALHMNLLLNDNIWWITNNIVAITVVELII